MGSSGKNGWKFVVDKAIELRLPFSFHAIFFTLKIFSFLLFFSLFSFLFAFAQEKQKKDELKLERNIRGNRFKIYNNYVSFGSGFSREITEVNYHIPMEVGYHFHIKRHNFKAGYFRSNVLGLFGYEYDRVLNDLHLGYGIRRETKALNVAFYACVSRAFGQINPVTGFGLWGAYAEAQFFRKLYYDVGAGATLFFEYNKVMPMAGLRIDFFLSGAYRGKINAD